MLKKILKYATSLAVAATMAAPVAAQFELDGEPRMALIVFSQVNDGGWAQSIDEARLRMEEDLGISIALVENVPENATAIVPAVELLIDRGFNVILGTAFGYSDTFKELSEKHPGVAFLNLAGTTNGPNLQSYYGRTYESQYLCGMAAAAASETGRLGFVAANPFGLVNWTINAYAMGARAINPDATVTAVFTGSWNDPVREREATVALIEQGIDVIGQHVDTPTPQIVAQERGIYGTGHHRDFREFAPDAVQCSSIWVWDRFLKVELEAISEGAWTPEPWGAFLSIAEGGTDIACCGDAISEEHAAQIMQARQDIMDGNLRVYAGPLADRNGEARVADGEVLGDAELWQMDWFVDGVISQVQ